MEADGLLPWAMTLFDSFPRAHLLDGRVADVFEAKTMEDMEAIGRAQHLPSQVNTNSPVGAGGNALGLQTWHGLKGFQHRHKSNFGLWHQP